MAALSFKVWNMQRPDRNRVPISCVETPHDAGDQVYFVQHGTKVEIIRFRLMTRDVSCAGKACDRAKPREGNVACGCVHDGSRSRPTVGEVTVRFEVPDKEVDGGGTKRETVRGFRSLRTTYLLFDNLVEYSRMNNDGIDNAVPMQRTKIAVMSEYVNEHGGWTVAGWIRLGEVQDASNEGVKVGSETRSLHLSLLVPTAEKVRNFQDEEFNKLRIKHEGTTRSARRSTRTNGSPAVHCRGYRL
jgi:hypothetical protein